MVFVASFLLFVLFCFLIVLGVGQVDPCTGMVMNISDLSRIVKAQVLDLLDHKNLDLDVPHFATTKQPSTTVNSKHSTR
jgi:6-pyruvoyl-tetrahydropterin synthase